MRNLICAAHILVDAFCEMRSSFALLWRHNELDCVSNNQPCDCLLNRLLRRRSKKSSRLRVTGLCVANSHATGEFPAQKVSNAENAGWRHHGLPVHGNLYVTNLPMSWKSKMSWRLEAARFGFNFFNHSKIRLTPRQQRCRDACQISKDTIIRI